MESSLQARERILIAAQKLFATKGYEQVTVREIAKEANCSHTSIYLYYQDKRELLAQLAEEPLTKLIQQFEFILSGEDDLARQKLVEIAIVYVKFGMLHRNLYQTFMTIEAGRVDEPGSDWKLSMLRQRIFALLQTSVSSLFIQPEEAQILAFSRILFYQLHGTITTYANSVEDIELIEERVLPLVEMSVTYLMNGVSIYEDK
ncbi:MAG: TetR/AcrR family transcriptional regulator [Candidatus Pristimantibacillus lignocellulolyticus]|uniref:TetR/AcrR family transcriptional regulator n=1 Tax=Candidatus Pristimantibacillus lignocellulolyticus TaxID=2994561 RepID=A0A9J6ZK10_9BACL|nr:MAG: TetR/AcrR family transcriptional regulator [Candidatus Pristimantibacillus lignocellulolyticus]